MKITLFLGEDAGPSIIDSKEVSVVYDAQHTVLLQPDQIFIQIFDKAGKIKKQMSFPLNDELD